MTTAEKIAYLKGIIAASNISDTQTKRIYDAMVAVLDSLAEDVEFNADNIDNIDSRLSEVDEDLDAVENFVFTDEMFENYAEDDFAEVDDDFSEDDFAEDDDFEEDDDDFDEYDELDDDEFEEEPVEAPAPQSPAPAPVAPAAEEAREEDEEPLEDEEDGEEMYEIECPACHETIYLQESVILDGAVDCPNCGEPLEFDIEFEEE